MEFEVQSQFKSQPPKERSPEYAKTLVELEQILGASKEERQEYIEKRIATLTENSESGEISHMGCDSHKGFLGPKMEIRRSLRFDPFVMDDPDLYIDLFEAIQKFREADDWKEQPLGTIVPRAIQWSLSKYFGNIIAGSNTEMQNRKFYIDHLSVDSLPISIKEFKGKKFAVCVEKAAAAQNLLAFVGIESELIVATGCCIPVEAEVEEEAHCYILIHGTKGDKIYDPSNPKLILDKDGELTSYKPAIYPITEEQSQYLISGKSVTIEHEDETIDENGQLIPDKSSRCYNGPRQNK